MRRISVMTLVLVLFSAAAALADSLRSAQHLVKIAVQPLSGDTRQYNVQIFDAETRKHVAHLKVLTKGSAPAEDETLADGTHYSVRIQPHGEAYLVDFKADDGAETIETMRGGFTTAAKPNPAPAHAARAGRDIDEPTVLRRVDALYTEEARAAGAAGTVVLEVRIDKSGFVREATLLKPMGYGLSESALDAVKQWQFTPSLHERKPVEVIHEVTVEFKP